MHLTSSPRSSGRCPDDLRGTGHADSATEHAGQVPVTGGGAGPAIRLPANAELVAGTRAGLLLKDRAGQLRLWLPGRAMRVLPGNPNWANGFAVSPALIAYGTRCRDASVPAKADFVPNAGYQECPMLRVFDVRSGRVRSFRSPAGTTGWVPPEFGLENPMTSAGSMIAAVRSSSAPCCRYTIMAVVRAPLTAAARRR